MTTNFRVDEDVITTFFIGDLKTFLTKFQGRLRHLKHTIYQDYKILLICDINWVPFIKDFVEWTIDLPDWFREKNLKPFNYEAVSENEQYTNPETYNDLMGYMRQFYNSDKAIEFWCPRGNCNLMELNISEYVNYPIPKLESDKPYITIYVNDIIKERIWNEVIDFFKEKYNVVVVNNSKYNINHNNISKFEDIIVYTKNSALTISNNDDYSHIPMILCSPMFIIGQRDEEFLSKCRQFNVPCKYKQVDNIKNITSQDIINNV